MSISIKYDLKQGDVNLKSTTLERVAKWFDEQHQEFADKSVLVHRKSVFQILEKLILYTNVDTGRLRASWMPFFEKYGMKMRALSIMTQAGAAGDVGVAKIDPQAMEEGKSMGFFIDDLFRTTIGTNVVYAPDVNARSGFITRAQVDGERIYNRNFERFFKAAEDQGMIPPEDDDSVDPGKGGD